ncbi:MAG: HDOD domain-containing protein [Deltaproteobacteria bacterium]|nr:HDOD domain-containing protein [Deltaproteobacteria bacterium]
MEFVPIRTKRAGRSRGADGFPHPCGTGRADPSFDPGSFALTLLDVIESPDYRPPILPPIATELLALATRVDVDLDEIVPLVERDGWFAVRLRAAASAEARATGVKLGSLRQVCLYFGLLQIRDLVIEESVADCVFLGDAHQDTMNGLRRHSLATGHLARSLAECSSVASELAYVAGLLHDVGIAGVLHVLTERDIELGPLPPPSVLWPAIERIHGRVGAIMARHWGFAPEIALAIEVHHDQPAGLDASPLAAALSIASELAHHEGFGLAEVALDGSGRDSARGADESSSAEPTELGPKEDGAPSTRVPATVLDRQLSLLGLERSSLHLIAHRARRALRDIDEASGTGEAG